MKRVYADLHIHIGKSNSGKRVKMMASGNLTFHNIAKEALEKKGLDLIGIVDCASLAVLEDIDALVTSGEIRELACGGLLYQNKLVIFLGSETELAVGEGFAHMIAYFPYLENIKKYAGTMRKYLKNPYLSTQKPWLSFLEWLEIVEENQGIVIPAHAFTPHKGFYGNCSASFKNVLEEDKLERILALELGLSADSFLADMITEARSKAFLSNSDAHSLVKIGREYNLLAMAEIDFQEFIKALKCKDGIIANYGLDPLLGKYHRSYCPKCDKIASGEPPELECAFCGSKSMIVGVLDRIKQIADNDTVNKNRPPYHYQVPLEFIPGLGPKMMKKLLESFGSEMAILHKATEEEIKNVAGEKVGDLIVLGRTGQLELVSGGGGIYGKVRV